ncbi:MAG: TetM/TetW/TetO/TetS family tetracycline resistance ribosomal protection protein [Clostridiales bacterium]|jgi:ribosomal protection tetracycline resistance protein|nr:TetM/TetW/TetO/TetS family tetracycline resistance ribosomal protection protein [Clostridiales bacterium]
MLNIRNIALMAHVDAGKTTLTERILFQSGVKRTLGSVNEGTTETDSLDVERARGISVISSLVSFEFGGVTVNLTDTPGHTDFFSQTERAFLALDACIVLVSASDGIQPGTETVIEYARENDVPILFFINKCDQNPSGRSEVLAQLKEALGGSVFDYAADKYETAALFDDDIAENFLSGAAEDTNAVNKIIAEKFKTREIYPVLCGSAQTGEGVSALMDAIADIMPPPDESAVNPAALSGVIFSVVHDKTFGRGALTRLYSGKLSVRDTLNFGGQTCKITIIKRQVNGKLTDAKELSAGGIALVFGLTNCRTGDCIGDKTLLPKRAAAELTKKALLTAQITPDNEADKAALKNALEMLSAEDPALEVEWDAVLGKMRVNLMGTIQKETLPAIIEQRFGLKVTIGETEIIYKETLVKPAAGFDAYTMPKPSWAILTFQLTPLPAGSGITYKCSAGPARLAYRYREQVAQSIAPSLKQGLWGWEVTDMAIELTDGEDHPIHTHPLDFTIATPLALFDGLRNGGTKLLEPVLSVKFTFEKTHLGRIISDIIKKRGQTGEQTYHGDNIILNAEIPLAEFLDYPQTFASVTSGHGVINQKLLGYRDCPPHLGKKMPRRGVDPNDRAKYILAARHALGGTVFE